MRKAKTEVPGCYVFFLHLKQVCLREVWTSWECQLHDYSVVGHHMLNLIPSGPC